MHLASTTQHNTHISCVIVIWDTLRSEHTVKQLVRPSGQNSFGGNIFRTGHLSAFCPHVISHHRHQSSSSSLLSSSSAAAAAALPMHEHNAAFPISIGHLQQHTCPVELITHGCMACANIEHCYALRPRHLPCRLTCHVDSPDCHLNGPPHTMLWMSGLCSVQGCCGVCRTL